MTAAAERNLVSFLNGGGETGALLRRIDWSASPLGDPATWSPELVTVVRIALGSAQPVLIVWGPEQTTLYNDGYAEMCGNRHPAALGNSFQSLWFDIWDQVEPIITDAYNGIATSMDDIEFTMHRNGYPEETHFAFSYTPVRDVSDTVLGMFCACTETTAKVRQDQNLKRFGRLFEQAPTFMALFEGADHRFAYLNPACEKLIGYRSVVGVKFADALPEAVEQGYLTLLNNVRNEGKAVAISDSPYAMQIVPGGPVDLRYVDFVYQPIRDDDDVVTGVFLSGYDVTDRTLVTNALAESEAKLRALNADLKRQVLERAHEQGTTWNVNPDLLAVVGMDGGFLATNPAWTKTLGYSANEMQGFSYADLLHPDDLPAAQDALATLADGKPVVQVENRYRAKDGRYHWFSWVCVPEAGKIYCIVRDVTAEKEKAQALAALEETLRQSQKMEAVGQLTGGLAHDFNNILAGISGSLEMMSTRLAQGRIGDLDRYITGATGASKRAAALTQRLLAFSRRQTLDPKPTDVNALVNGMLDMINRSMGPTIHVETAGAAGLWTTLIDAGQLENALLNLCLNARDAMPHGGSVTIETSNRWIDDRSGKERDLAPGQYVSLCVSDTGTGMSPEIIARAFDPFFTTKPTGQGTGLGLSMVHGFSGQSGGSVRIYSEIDKGTMICLYLPRHIGDGVTEVLQETPKVPDRSDQSETILLVDDEALVRMIAGEQLEEMGYTVIEAADGPSALKILNSAHRIDLLITDVGLPGGMNGRQLADAARLARPDLEVLFITGYAENAVLNHGHLDHGMHVMTKPFQMDSFARRVGELLAPGVS